MCETLWINYCRCNVLGIFHRIKPQLSPLNVKLQQEEMLNALETTLLLGVKFESNKVMDVLLQYFAQHHGIGNFQLPMSIDLFKLIKIITAEDESKLSLAIVNSTNQIRAKCDFKLEDMRSLLKDNLQQWEFVKDSKFVKEVSAAFLFYE
mgnify:CR=1 FL=1